MQIAGPRGTHDILPGEVEKWQYIEGILRKMCQEYGYSEIRTPIFEHTELFHRGVGETTDIVEKEMYTFFDRGERSITLRPEGTASTVRAYLEHKLYTQPQPSKFYYTGPMFRYERPQAGRYRQFHQFGIEVFGSAHPSVDAEVIGLAMDFYSRLGVKDLAVHINSVGCPKCRPAHRDKLQEFLRPHLEELCTNCKSRFDRNPLRILDCKSSTCKAFFDEAPTTLDCLCEECATHFEEVKKHLSLIGVNYIIDRHLVRGLDYYTKTAFEIKVKEIGAQSTICGGGRYDGLVEQCGGPATPGIGFALGMERLFPSLASQGIELPVESKFDVFVAGIGEAAGQAAFKLLFDLRQAGFSAEKDYLGRSLKAQMKYANKFNVKFTVIIGEDELVKKAAVVREMATSNQEEVAFDNIVQYLKEKHT